jgi:hypothetical protein
LSMLRRCEDGTPNDHPLRAQHVPFAAVLFLQEAFQHAREASVLEAHEPEVARAVPIPERLEGASNCSIACPSAPSC